MAELSEQVMTIERALGERMIEHAMLCVRSWLNELGENNRYEHSYNRIRKEYGELCAQWRVQGGTSIDEPLDKLVGEAYQLSDAIFADLCMARGMAPKMYGFNPTNRQSVLQYFAHCLQLADKDLEWMRSVADDESKTDVALLAVGALTHNIRENFNIPALLALIDCMNAQCEMVANVSMAFASMLLIHYDVRIDFFPQIQDAYMQALDTLNNDSYRVVQMIGLMIQFTKDNGLELYSVGEYRYGWLPEYLRKLLEATGTENDVDAFRTWLPMAEGDYLNGVVQIFPDTWVYKQLIEGDEEREHYIALCYLYSGRMDLMWNRLDEAEEWLKTELRNSPFNQKYFLNYGHCIMLKGDRVMAYEYYCQARDLFYHKNDFYSLFLADRQALIDHGIPVDDVYLMEDMVMKP